MSFASPWQCRQPNVAPFTSCPQLCSCILAGARIRGDWWHLVVLKTHRFYCVWNARIAVKRKIEWPFITSCTSVVKLAWLSHTAGGIYSSGSNSQTWLAETLLAFWPTTCMCSECNSGTCGHRSTSWDTVDQPSGIIMRYDRETSLLVDDRRWTVLLGDESLAFWEDDRSALGEMTDQPLRRQRR